VIEVRTPERSVTLSRAESWQLYIWLGEGAPFVRNQLRVLHQGGAGAVSVGTPEECIDVRKALGTHGRKVTGGLRSLLLALTD
jgi:hypothetical protein